MHENRETSRVPRSSRCHRKIDWRPSHAARHSVLLAPFRRRLSRCSRIRRFLEQCLQLTGDARHTVPCARNHSCHTQTDAQLALQLSVWS
jgi:hypothetical protein